MLEDEIINWSKDIYQEKIANTQENFNTIMLVHLPLADLLDTFVFGLTNRHMPMDQAPINWKTDEFLQDLERIFEARPPVGQNEIKSIRRPKLLDILHDWIVGLESQPDEQHMRHRIFGYFGSLRLVDAIVAKRLFERDGGASQELAPADAAYFKEIFGHDFQVTTNGQNERLIVQLIRQARHAYTTRAWNLQKAYDDVMIASALNEELIEAAIHTVVDNVLTNESQPAEAHKRLVQNLQNIFLTKPTVSIPQQRDSASIAVFKEDVVAWGLAFYKTYSDRMDRFQQEELSSEIVSDSVISMIDDTIYATIGKALEGGDVLDSTQVRRLESECRLIFRQSPRLSDESSEGMDPNFVMDQISEWAKKLYDQRVKELGRELVTRLERYYVLEKIDENWRQHLHGIDELREGIGLRGYGQKDPLLEYKREAFGMFERTIDSINRETASTLFKVFDVGGEVEEQHMRRIEPQSFATSHSQVEVFKQVMAAQAPRQQQQRAQPARPGERQRVKTVVKAQRVGRNEPCPCGSGKKYKNCCGKYA
ncbi:hypothetical protein EH223_11845 [candidate division KSB1 bacterium]|nr:SEC-C domain-containing protein [candidate division KSB1 bacterium]RQW02716.1 MAG: hypothetical protein EH223_11845 [candidate division KSB1 bacterium]